MKLILFLISFNLFAQDVIFLNDHEKNQCVKSNTQIFKILDSSPELYKVELFEKNEEVFNGITNIHYSSEGVKMVRASFLDKYQKIDCSLLL
jgi:hypothetical protein